MKKQIIFENQVGLHIQNGRIIRQVGPGAYHVFGFLNDSYMVYSLAPQAYNINNSYSTNDMASIFVDMPINIYARDIRKLYLSGVLMYEAANRAFTKHIQELIGAKNLADILEDGVEVDANGINVALAEFGIEVSVEGAARIRLPRNLQNAIDAQEVARQRAKAELEEARGRTAVIRHYANAAKLTKDNPDLLRLMLGQKAKSINVAFDAK